MINDPLGGHKFTQSLDGRSIFIHKASASLEIAGWIECIAGVELPP